MISEFLAQHTWLWPLAWQSTTALTLGLGASFLLRRRPVRAHQLLLWALIAAIAVPALSHWVERHQWGLFQSNPTATKIDVHPTFVTPTPSNPERAVQPATTAGPTAMTEGPATTHILRPTDSAGAALAATLDQREHRPARSTGRSFSTGLSSGTSLQAV